MGDIDIPREVQQAIYEEVMLKGALEDLKRIDEIARVVGVAVADDIGDLRQRLRDAIGIRRDIISRKR